MKKRKRPLEAQQDAVLHDYAMTPALSRKSTEALHLFFSPLRIPIGLTDSEVQICCLLYPIKKAQTERAVQKAMKRHPKQEDPELEMGRLAKAALHEYPLPEELGPSEKMTRGRFRAGIWKFLQNAHK